LKHKTEDEDNTLLLENYYENVGENHTSSVKHTRNEQATTCEF
jgi:hypothetical protein